MRESIDAREASGQAPIESTPFRAVGARLEYDAFMSYSHAADGLLVAALQDHLQRFAKPWYRRRSLRLFRDKTGLAVTPDLWRSICAALAAAKYFILFASEQAAQSQWIEQEVDFWLEPARAGANADRVDRR